MEIVEGRGTTANLKQKLRKGRKWLARVKGLVREVNRRVYRSFRWID